MDATAHYKVMARYNRWMNERVYAAAATLPDDARKRDVGAFFRSLHGTLNHLLLADRIWLGRLHGDPPRFLPRDGSGAPAAITTLAHELYADFGELRAERARTDDELLAYADTLTADALAAPLSFRSLLSPTAKVQPLWTVLSHVFNHETHHRGQATALLSQLGVDPGATDLIAFVWEEMAAGRLG